MYALQMHPSGQLWHASGGSLHKMAGAPRPLLRIASKPPSTVKGIKAMSSVSSVPTSEQRPTKRETGLLLPTCDNTVPSERALELWQKAEAVCFDVDCTITVNDSLDLLAEFMGVGEEVKRLTDRAMNGSIDLNESLEERLRVINCKPEDVRNFIKAYPPQARLTKGIESLIKVLQARGVKIYLISGGFRELMLPIAAHLGIPRENVFANRMLWQWDDETEEPSRLVGFDMSEPTAHQQGKPQAIAKIRRRSPYSSVVMIGDGITDLEATEGAMGADLFIGYGGVVERPRIVASADWYITDFDVLRSSVKRSKVAMIGGGSWACAAMTMVAQNTKQDDPANNFVDSIRMWVHGQEVADVINETNENPKYLPGIPLGKNVMAVSDLEEAVEDADMIIFCVPHQFIRGICKKLVGKVKRGAIAISLIKGMRVQPEGPQLISQMVQKTLGIDCCVLMGANIAQNVADKELSEAVIGYSNLENAQMFKKLLARPHFRINLLPDAAGAEMCGTLKNVVALGAGMVDGMGLGANTKAAILREGLDEMKRFSQALYPSIRDETFLESCGLADLIATCYGGRNRLVAEEFAKAKLAGEPATFESLEASLLNGQKLQGVLTSDEVQEILKLKGWEQDYPLFTTINRIINYELPVTYIVDYVAGATAPTIRESVPVPAPAVSKKGTFGALLSLANWF